MKVIKRSLLLSTCRLTQQASWKTRGLPNWAGRCPRFAVRAFCSSNHLLKALVSHPAVSQCAIVDGIAYVIRGTGDASDLLGSSVEDWELEKYLWVTAETPHVPKVRFIDELPSAGCSAPFTSVHILDALFRKLDAGDGQISFQSFSDFCRNTQIFDEDEASTAFLKARTMPSTSELLRSSSDLFQLPEFDANKIRFYEFQKLMQDAGIVEIRCDHPGDQQALVSYFVDERVVDIVLKRWFAKYAGDADTFTFEQYARLVSDYRLNFSVSEEAFRRGGGDAFDLAAFRTVLVAGGVLQTGSSLGKDDEVGRVWRRIEDSQVFLPPTRVFVADGREGTSPPRVSGALRFVCISDTHSRHRELTSKLPPGDVLLHAGDFTMGGSQDEVLDFVFWLQSLPYSRKIIISGNHDLSLDKTYTGEHSKDKSDTGAVREAFTNLCAGDESITYLEDDVCSIQGLRVYGTPWQPEFGFWAFNLPRGEAIAKKWKAVPSGVDILLVHGPALGRGDISSGKRVGCEDLLYEVQNRIKPAFLVCGHVHEGAGATFDGTTHFLNASSLDENYECVHAPLLFDMPIPKG